MNIKLERSLERGHTNVGWLDSYHSFSFGDYKNPNRMDFGALRVLNEDRIAHGQGFGGEEHEHANMEIVTVPIKGVVHHTDSLGNDSRLGWGEFQVMSAGTGMMHSEFNDEEASVLELLQIWIKPEVGGTEPTYAIYDFRSLIHPNEMVTLIAPDGTAPAKVKQNAWIAIGDFERATQVKYKVHGDNMGVYLLVVNGKLKIGDIMLEHGDGIGVDLTDMVDFIPQPHTKVLLIEVPMVTVTVDDMTCNAVKEEEM